ncbi:hypothetical protein [Adhaeribacter terreus]|uniref:Uncharacterized protein n=1 Tax=Adhaeribacter terreus TaxID=529703 RepID=A0ABW0E7K8_9BACT
MQPDRHYIKIKAIAIALIVALIIIRISANGWDSGACDGVLCAFNLIGPFLLGLITFFIVFFISLKILDKG